MVPAPDFSANPSWAESLAAWDWISIRVSRKRMRTGYWTRLACLLEKACLPSNSGSCWADPKNWGFLNAPVTTGLGGSLAPNGRTMSVSYTHLRAHGTPEQL